jgi:hypothetical protein
LKLFLSITSGQMVLITNWKKKQLQRLNLAPQETKPIHLPLR